MMIYCLLLGIDTKNIFQLCVVLNRDNHCKTNHFPSHAKELVIIAHAK